MEDRTSTSIMNAREQFADLAQHVGHEIVVVTYGGDPADVRSAWNVAIECETCSEVLLDLDNE